MLVGAMSLVACKGAADKAADAASAVTETVTDVVDDVKAELVGDAYAVNTGTSSLTWTGGKKVGGSSHSGTFSISEGSLGVDKGDITGGTFTIDINSMKNTDMAGSEGAGKLEGHLKSPDFFNVAEFPNATFAITKVTKVMNNPAMTHTVSGDLTMMGVTKNISLPASITIADGKVMATVKDFNLNRTDWGMKYGSGLLGLAADKIINDDVVIGLSLEAAM